MIKYYVIFFCLLRPISVFVNGLQWGLFLLFWVFFLNTAGADVTTRPGYSSGALKITSTSAVKTFPKPVSCNYDCKDDVEYKICNNTLVCKSLAAIYLPEQKTQDLIRRYEFYYVVKLSSNNKEIFDGHIIKNKTTSDVSCYGSCHEFGYFIRSNKNP